MLRRIAICSLVFVLSGLLTAGLLSPAPPKASAAEYSPAFKWFNNSFDYEDISTSSAGDWTSSVYNGAYDWYLHTKLYVHTSTTASYYEIQAVAQNNLYYPVGWTTAYSNLHTCISYPSGLTGYCNTSTEPATTGVIDLNDYWYDTRPAYAWWNLEVATHEIGHLFGLAHPPCQNLRIMEDGTCSPRQNTVTSYDASDIAAKY